jgi:hypothetical protein
MPYIPAVGAVLSFRAWNTFGVQAAVNTFNYRIVTQVGAGINLTQLAQGFDTMFAPLWKPCMASVATYNGIQCYVNANPPPLPGTTVASAGPGTDAPLINPTQVCGITTWLSGFIGPGNRGRTYWPFSGPDEDTAAGTPDPSLLVNYGLLSDGIINLNSIAVGADAFNLALIIKRGKNKAGVIPASPIVTAYTVRAKWATQKRRGIYGKPNVSPI